MGQSTGGADIHGQSPAVRDICRCKHFSDMSDENNNHNPTGDRRSREAGARSLSSVLRSTLVALQWT